MALSIGIVGLPNVGKSTLFNALTSTAAAEAANYPFCTIEPNTGIVAVPDGRMAAIAAIAKTHVIIPTQLEFVDIAGLVKGASKGEGLGNKFLANIREVDAIVHVLRCFTDGDIIHVEGNIDPIRDSEIIETELILADMESVDKRIPALEKRAKGGADKEAKATLDLLLRIKPLLNEGKSARTVTLAADEKELFKQLQLLTGKPILYVCNVAEEEAATGNELTAKVEAMAATQNAKTVTISARIEEEVSQLETEEEKKEFLEALGLDETGLSKLIRRGYELLGLITYFTAGVKEVRAWTVHKGATAPNAAGVIHTDFERGFIKAETIAYNDYVELGGEAAAKEKGKLRLEGKEYVVHDGDIMHFKFNV